MVYMRDKTHTYLMLSRNDYNGRFLTLDSGTIEVVSVPLIDGCFYVGHDQLMPYSYDFLKAVEKYANSHLQKTPEAQAELAALLGQPQVPLAQLPVKTPPKALPEASVGPYTIIDLARDTGLSPEEIRKRLRKLKVERPGGRWEWPSVEAAEPLRSLLK